MLVAYLLTNFDDEIHATFSFRGTPTGQKLKSVKLLRVLRPLKMVNRYVKRTWFLFKYLPTYLIHIKLKKKFSFFSVPALKAVFDCKLYIFLRLSTQLIWGCWQLTIFCCFQVLWSLWKMCLTFLLFTCYSFSSLPWWACNSSTASFSTATMNPGTTPTSVSKLSTVHHLHDKELTSIAPLASYISTI